MGTATEPADTVYQAALAKAQSLSADNQDKILDLLTVLICKPTFAPEQISGVIPLLREAMARSGYEIEEHGAPNRSGLRMPSIIGWLGEKKTEPDILLCAHIDTSPGGDGWDFDPFGAERRDGFVFGRGAVVSKSDAASFIHTASFAAIALGNRLPFSLAVAVTGDEGSGGDFGAAYLLNRLKLRPKIAVFPGVTDRITVSHNGCIQLKVRIQGTACHQSVLPEREDAMRYAIAIGHAVYRLSDALRSVRPDLPDAPVPTLNITRMAGGTEFGMSPREVEIWIDRRVTPSENMEEVSNELVRAIDETAHGDVRITHETVRSAEPMRTSAGQERFVRILQEEASILYGQQPSIGGSTLYTDARWFSNAGIPTIMYGPGEADTKRSGANGINERVSEEHIQQATTTLARSIVRFITEGNDK